MVIVPLFCFDSLPLPSFIHRRPLSPSSAFLLQFRFLYPTLLFHFIMSIYQHHHHHHPLSVGRSVVHSYVCRRLLLTTAAPYRERVEHPARHKKTWRTESRRKEKRIIQGRFCQLKRHIREEELKSKTTERNSSLAHLPPQPPPPPPVSSPSFPPFVTPSSPWECGEHRRRKSNCALGIPAVIWARRPHGEREMHLTWRFF